MTRSSFAPGHRWSPSLWSSASPCPACCGRGGAGHANCVRDAQQIQLQGAGELERRRCTQSNNGHALCYVLAALNPRHSARDRPSWPFPSSPTRWITTSTTSPATHRLSHPPRLRTVNLYLHHLALDDLRLLLDAHADGFAEGLRAGGGCGWVRGCVGSGVERGHECPRSPPPSP